MATPHRTYMYTMHKDSYFKILKSIYWSTPNPPDAIYPVFIPLINTDEELSTQSDITIDI